MKTIIFIISMLSINAMATEKPLEVCKKISAKGLYACDVGRKVIFLYEGQMLSFPKEDFSSQVSAHGVKN